MKKLFFLPVIFLLSVAHLLSQDVPHTFFLGLSGSFATNFHSGDIHNEYDVPEPSRGYQPFHSANDQGMTAGLNLTYFWDIQFRQLLGSVTAKIYYEKQFETIFDGATRNIQISEDDTNIAATRHFSALSRYSSLNAEFLFNQKFVGSEVTLIFGGGLAIPVNATLTKRETLITPEQQQYKEPAQMRKDEGVYLTDNNRTLNYGDADINSLRYYGKAGVGYDFIFSDWLIQPQILYSYDFTAVSSDEPKWNLSTLQIAVNVLYGL